MGASTIQKQLAGLSAFTVELTEVLGEERQTHLFFFMVEAEQSGSTKSCATWLGMKIAPHRYRHEDACFATDFEMSRWQKRAWTFQEEMLSRRKICFGFFSLYFLCPHKTYHENDPVPHRNYSSSLAELLETDGDGPPYDRWYAKAGDYTEQTLSKREDKFPALAGLASRFAGLIKDEYIAGLWRNDLIIGLTWSTRPVMSWAHFSYHIDTKDPANAPSWSWASRDGYFEIGTTSFVVQPRRKSLVPNAILCVEVEPTGEDSFGRINGASIHIDGLVREAPATMNQTERKVGNNDWDLRFDNDHTALLPTRLAESEPECRGTERSSITQAWNPRLRSFEETWTSPR